MAHETSNSERIGAALDILGTMEKLLVTVSAKQVSGVGRLKAECCG